MSLVQYHEITVAPPTGRYQSEWAAGEDETVAPPPSLTALKKAVAEAKSGLDGNGGMDHRSMGRKMRNMDPFSGFRIPTAQCVSNSWFKYYEIFGHFCRDILAARKPSVFFNAELPGGSLAAWNHFCLGRTNWFASSLWPGEEATDNTALPDRHGLYSRNPGHWLMGPNAPGIGRGKPGHASRGDATSIECIEYWQRECGRSGGVDLYSHDAGMDASSDYNNQELINARLHLGCALTGLLTLREGGTFIAKHYTPFETCTISLIAALAGEFANFYLVKPESSRARNSEIYLVGKGYRGVNEPLVEKMKSLIREGGDNLFELSAETFSAQAETIGSIIQFAGAVYTKQIESIDLLLKSDSRHDWRADIAAIRSKWLERHPVPPLPPASALKTYSGQ